MRQSGSWGAGEVVAWTEHDGMGRAPAAPSRVLSLVLAASLGVVFVGMLSTDTLCPEHRAWVIGLGILAVSFTAVAVVGLVQGWAIAPLLTLLVSLDGVAVGLIDATHDASRGRTIAVAFGVAAVLAALLAWRSLRLAAWDRGVRRQLATSGSTASASTRRASVGAGAGPGATAPPARKPAREPVDAPADHPVRHRTGVAASE